MAVKRPTLGVITNFQRGVFQRAVIQGIQQVADLHSFDVVVDSIADEDRPPRPVSLNIESLAGLVVISNAIPDEQIRAYQASGVPLSLISHQIPGTTIPAVVTDNGQGMARLMRHLVEECDRRRIVFIRGLPDQTDGHEREVGFQREVMRYMLDLPDEFILSGDFSPETAARAMQKFIAQRRDFDAVLASDYLMGIAALDVLLAAGFDVPGSVCVSGYGDGDESEERGLTTVAADVVEQGRRGARQLMGQMRGLTMRGVTVLSTHLLPRQTTIIQSKQGDS
jgi:DNA-binding LacI/PurR family transcriptional regulator